MNLTKEASEQPNLNSPAIMLDFGQALKELKKGNKVARIGWNGKSMWLVLIKAGNNMFTDLSGAYPMQNCIGIKTANENMQPGWLASQADILAEDWNLI